MAAHQGLHNWTLAPSVKQQSLNHKCLMDISHLTIWTAGNTLEGDVSDVIALDQLTSLFSPRKATKMSP